MSVEQSLQRSAVFAFEAVGFENLNKALGKRLWMNGSDDRLRNNQRACFQEVNADALNGEPLSDAEWVRVKNQWPLTIKDAFDVLRGGITIMRDNNTPVNLVFLNTQDWTKNRYQVAEEVSIVGVSTTRFDVLVFINGLAVANMEFKAPGRPEGLKEATAQINRYSRNGSYSVDLMRFIQLFAVSNGEVTKYFPVNPAAAEVEARSQHGSRQFRWTDANNRPVSRAPLFVESFFRPEQLWKMLTRYMLRVPGRGSDPYGVILALRPYQLFAVEAAHERVEAGQNALVWHATGSGKTLTSFVLARDIAEDPNVDKVVMLLDRNDLADQTTAEYAKFDRSGTIARGVEKGRHLHKAVMGDDPLVVTTMQSFSKWVNRYRRSSAKLGKRGRIVFIVDECHRTTFGEMFTTVRRTFPGAMFIGFTGTPRMAENQAGGGRVTTDLFGEPAHVYTIKDAIDDGNVLRFNIQVAEVDVRAGAGLEVGTLTYYHHPTRLAANTEFIAHNIHKHTGQNDLVRDPVTTSGFTAMLAADSKHSAFTYWKSLHPSLAARGRRTTLVFSLEDNKEWEDGLTDREKYLEVLQAWDEDWGTSYVARAEEDLEGARVAHLRDVSTRTRAGEVDLLIVSDMLLTGFDAPAVNTLYLDKSLEHHNLLQAMSRTNRTNGPDKHTGNIVVFTDRDLREPIDAAVRLFSINDNIGTVTEQDSFQSIIDRARDAARELKLLYPGPEALGQVRDIDALANAARLLSTTQRNTAQARTYTEWDQSFHPTYIGLGQHKADRYTAHLSEARAQAQPTSEKDHDTLATLDLFIHETGHYLIDVAYITRLLHNFVAAPPEAKARWIEEAERRLTTARDTPDLVKHAEAIKSALQYCRDGYITNEEALLDLLAHEQARVWWERVQALAVEHGLERTIVEDWVWFYYAQEHHADDMMETLKAEHPDWTFKSRRESAHAIKESIETHLYEFPERDEL